MWAAGSVVTSNVRWPRPASQTAVAHEMTVLPTPPLPAKKTVRGRSFGTSVASAVESLGAPDVLVNAAGWDRIMRFLDTDEAFWDRVIAINFRGVVATCHAVLPHMVERGSGAVVNVASEAGRAGSRGFRGAAGETSYTRSVGKASPPGNNLLGENPLDKQRARRRF